MKRKSILLVISILICVVSFSQYRNYKTETGWNIGFNFGGTWQEKEAVTNGAITTTSQPFTSIRGGFTFGKALYEEEGSLLAFDLRFRYLRGINYGWANVLDTIPSSEFLFSANDIEAYKNYRMDLNEFSLEGVLTLNRLLEQTGIILYGFGGIGAVDYRVKTDYLDGSSQYSYPDLTDQSSRNAAKLLKNNSDLQFEFNAPGAIGNQLKVMPSLGFGLGYQFNEVFSIGLEHKLTFALHNNLDGMTTDNLNDRYHYTAIKMSFNILEGTSSDESNEMFQEEYYQPSVSPPSTTITNTTNPIPPPLNSEPPITAFSNETPPLVNIVFPKDNYTDVNSVNYTIKAKLMHVDNKQNISFFINGIKQPNYLFNYNANIFSADIQLKLGQNQFKITGQNQAGSAHDQVLLNYIPFAEKKPPTVIITSPLGNPHLSELDKCLITAKTTNISSASQVKFYVNNTINTSFTLSINSAINGVFKANIPLINGNNTVLIRVTNNDGNASDNTIIIYEKRNVGTPPNVVITSPDTNPFQTKQQNATIKAFAYQVDKKQNITVMWNNSQTQNYTFNNVTKQITINRSLNEGNNTITITAKNDFGSDAENSTIYYQKNKVINLPKVTIDYPSSAVYNTDKEVILINGKIDNVASITNVTAIFNNKPSKYFDFNLGSKAFQATLTLVPGNNIFTVNANNSSGSDSDQVTIVYTPVECDNPAINRILPQNSTVSTTNTKAYIEMQVLNTQNVEFKIDGNSSSGYNFDVNTGVFSSMLNLNTGTTVYSLSASNDCGTTSQTVTFQLSQQPNQGQSPNIQMNVTNTSSSDSNPIIVNASSLQLTGKITNYDSNTMMSYSSSPVNKVKLDYILSTGTISGTVFLPPNQVIKVTISAENKWGKNSKEIYFKKPERATSSGNSNNSKTNIKSTKSNPSINPESDPPSTNNNVNNYNYYQDYEGTITTPSSNDTENDLYDDSDSNNDDDTYEEPFSWPEAPEQKEEWSAPPPPPAPAPIIKPQKKETQKTSQPSRSAVEKTVKPNPIKPKSSSTKKGWK